MAERQKGNPRKHSEESVKLFVGQVPKHMTEAQLLALFKEFALVDEVNIIKDKVTRASRGCCFVICPSREEADKAVGACHNKKTLPGASSPLQVKYADGELERLEHRLFVGMLPKNVSEADVSALFSQYGTIKELQILRGSQQTSKCCAFVKYETEEQALAAMDAVNGKHKMEGSNVPLVVRSADMEKGRQARRAPKAQSQISNAYAGPSLFGAMPAPGDHGLVPYGPLPMQNQPLFHNMVKSVNQGSALRGARPDLSRGAVPKSYSGSSVANSASGTSTGAGSTSGSQVEDRKSGLMEIDEDVLHYDGGQAAFENAQGGSASKSKGKMICEDEIGMETNPPASADVELIQMICKDAIEREGNPAANNEVELIQMSHDLESELRGAIEPKIPDAEQMLISHDRVGWDPLIKPDTPALISIPDPRSPVGVFDAGPSAQTIKELEMMSTSFGTDILCQEGVVEVAEGVIEPKIPDAEQMLISHDQVGWDTLIKPDIPASISIPDPGNPIGVFEAGPSDNTIKEPEMMITSFGADILCQEGVVEVAEGVIEPKIPDAEQMLISHDQVGQDTLIKPDIPASISIFDPGNPVGVFEAVPSDKTIKESEMMSTSFGTDILSNEGVVEVAKVVIEPKIPDAEQMLIPHDPVGWDNLIKLDTPASISIPDPGNPVGVFEAGPSDKTIREPEMTSTSFGTDILCQEAVVEVAEGAIEPQIPDAEQMLTSHDRVGRDTCIKLDTPASISIPDPRNPDGVFEAGPSDKTIREPEMTCTSFGTEILCLEEVVEVAEEMQISNDLEIELNRLVEADIISTPTRDIFVNPKMQASTSVQTCHGESIDQLSVQAESTQQNRILSPSQVNIHRPVHHTVEKILEALKYVQSRRICLHGSGGSGKTTVLRTLSLHPDCTNLFDQIIFVSIPRLGRRRKIQHRIAQQLSLNVPESSSADETAAQIYDALVGRDGKILLLLDDVCEKMNLDELGIPNPGPEHGCWLVFATRSLDNRFYQPSSQIKMEVLSTAESWELFRCKVGNIVDSEIEPYAQDIVKKCHGLPLIISAVGSALNMESKIMEWKLARSRFTSFDSSHSRYSASPHIKYCYDRLKAEGAKACFLYCALFASDREIDISMLVDCFIAEGLLGGRTLAAYRKGHDIVKHLVDASLLEATANGCKVKMHNVIRDTALSILSSSTEGYEMLTGSCLKANPVPRSKMLSSSIDKYLIGADAQLKEPVTLEEWREAEMIFLTDNRSSTLPSQPSCPALKALFLQRNNCLRVIPSSFFDSMNALTILNLTKTRIACLPDSFSKLKNLEVLVLRDCERMSMLPSSIGCLEALKVLDLEGTELTHLPDSVCKLASLKHLRVSFYGSIDHSECKELPANLIPDGAISRLDLTELGIFVHPGDQRWASDVINVISEVSNLELSALYFHFPNGDLLNHFLCSNESWKQGKLSAFNFIVGHDFKHAVSQVSYDAEMMHNAQKRVLRFVNGENMPRAVQEVLSRITSLYLDHHLSICSLSDFGIHKIIALKICIVRDCPNIRAIVHDPECSHFVFPFLEYLSINYLWNLEKIWPSQVTAVSFAMLRYLSVQACPKLRYVLTCSMLDILINLEELVIEDCASLEYIVIKDEEAIDDSSSSEFVENPCVYEISGIASATPVLHSLKVLKLNYLPKLRSIWKGSWPPLEYMSICECPMVKNLHMEANDGVSIKEIATDKDWWDILEWDHEDMSTRLKERITQIRLDDL